MAIKFKLHLGEDTVNNRIYLNWFSYMGWLLNDTFIFAESSNDERGLMYVLHEKDDPDRIPHLVHKSMFKPVEPTTNLEDWL